MTQLFQAYCPHVQNGNSNSLLGLSSGPSEMHSIDMLSSHAMHWESGEGVGSGPSRVQAIMGSLVCREFKIIVRGLKVALLFYYYHHSLTI